MQPSWWAYPLAFAVAGGLSLFLTPAVLRVAVRRGILDEPGGHKSHAAPIPYLGGVAIVLSFSVVVLAAAFIFPPPSQLGQFATIILAALALAAVGLVDDLRGLGPWIRFAAQIGAAVVLFAVGVRVQLFDVAAADLMLTVLWVVGITNSFNLLDNMDGLSAGVATIAAGSFFVIAAVNGQFLVAAFAIALAGCAVGFLRHNFHPAKIYMGDAGSLFLGFLLAAIGIKLRFEGPTSVTFIVPLVVLGVAVTDTSLVTATRLLHRRNPLSGGRDHISHRLVFVGIPVPVAVALIYGAAVAHGYLALVLSRVDVTTGYMLMAFVVGVDLFFAVLLANVPVYESSTRRRYMLQEVQGHERTDELPKVSA